ncbi:hypothetical protein Daus18300_010315 [Diaporthe australafricana]|uniref:Uncharacterized protein n=1 Tax=Diaporthe australafricana TaxID=127596 RepID=A0ABR3WAS8_9PEZI
MADNAAEWQMRVDERKEKGTAEENVDAKKEAEKELLPAEDQRRYKHKKDTEIDHRHRHEGGLYVEGAHHRVDTERNREGHYVFEAADEG